ncbi:HAMP domain-containing sensor histidine kinase [Brevibacillus borstelensis]|uniref:HAMP domain-containing sensor histidine kinase n=1 Tax=Brevibacillus borstelensis TaxID=45462 RepID=UPI002E21901D|nr:HAMP domain-containing sensor histidine kinase [Brevibacillus borstelensis]
MSLLKEIILQIFFALIPFVAFNIYYRDKIRNYSQTFILLTSSLCLFLAMTFASNVVDGVIFDIRYVIMFFGLVYGGVQTGIILIVEFVIYRLYLGGEGMPVAMIILACTFSLSLLFYKLYKANYRRTFVTFLSGIAFSVIPLVLTYSFFPNDVKEHLAYHLIVIPMQNSLGTWLLLTLFGKSVADKEMFIRHAQNEKIETMSHVAASLAHEVRNPLTAVKGFLKLIQEDHKHLPKLEQYINICLGEVQRTELILSEYLSISKPLTARHEVINFSEQLYVIREVMSPYANMHNVELEVHAPDSPVPVLANPDEIKQVLVNFIKNAVEACSEVSDAKVILRLSSEEDRVVLKIKDNGIGMTESQMKRLGSIYFSTKSNGTGLGLTYSYQVIHAMGGTVTVASKPGAGTKFTLIFPEAEQVG